MSKIHQYLTCPWLTHTHHHTIKLREITGNSSVYYRYKLINRLTVSYIYEFDEDAEHISSQFLQCLSQVYMAARLTY